MAHSGVFDPSRGRMIVFGGANAASGLLSDLWMLSFEPLPTWTLVTPPGSGPSARWDHAAAYDPIGDRMLIFGGADNSSQLRNDLWALSLANPMTWTEIATQGPAPSARASHVAVFDPVGNRLLVHGGWDGGIEPRADLWEVAFEGTPTWRQLAPAGATPIARRDAIATYDAARSRILLHGGNAGFAPFLSDAWGLDLATLEWTLLEPSGVVPDGAITHGGTYDVARDQLVLFGGNYHNETWALSLAEPIEWERLLPAAPLPPGRIDHSLVFDPMADRLLAFGGHTGLATLDDTWALDLRSPVDSQQPDGVLRLRVAPNPATTEVTFSFGAPLALEAQVLIYDVRGRALRSLPASAMREGVRRWDLRDATGERVPAGVYFCRLQNGRENGVARLVIEPESSRP